MRPLDSFDKQLLQLLQRNNRLTAEELSAAVNLSASAVQRRLKKLREDGVIEAEVADGQPQCAAFLYACRHGQGEGWYSIK